MTFQNPCIDTLRGAYNDLDSLLFLLEAIFFTSRCSPACLISGLLFFSSHDPCLYVPFDVSHDSGLCRFPLACMGLVFSFMLLDMLCWRKRR